MTVTGALLLAGCGDSSDDNDNSNDTTGDAVSLEFWTINLKEGYSDYIEASIRRYEADHKNVTIKWVDVPDFQKTSSKLLAALSGGAAPDVVNVTPFILPQFATMGVLTSIDEITDDAGAIEDEYLRGFWDAGVIDGKAYAIPFYGSVSALIYNAELFKKAGLDPNRPPTTWDEVFQAAKTIHAKTGKAGFVQTMDNFSDAGNPSDVLAGQAGVPLLNDDQTHATFNQPEGVNMLANYAEGVKEGWISRTSATGEVLDGARELAQGNAAMVFLGPWIVRWLEDNTEKDTFAQFRVAPHPTGPSGAANAFLQNFVIPKASEHPKDALSFARFMSSTTLELAKQAPVLAPLKELAKDPYFRSKPETKVLVEQEADFFWPKHPKVAELFDALRQQFQAAMLGQKSPEQALDEAAKQWDQILGS